MTKGRKLTPSRSELLLGSYGQIHGGDGGEELVEHDVWSMVDDMVSRSDGACNSRAAMQTNPKKSYRNPVRRGDDEWNSRATVRRGDGVTGGLSSALEDAPGKMVSSPRIVHQFINGEFASPSPRGRHVASSAPVNVPDWSKIYRVDSVESMHDPDDLESLDNMDCMVPPHEYLARASASTRGVGANSVFVGVGRTLKGRDLSRVRDAVWSQTGFNG